MLCCGSQVELGRGRLAADKCQFHIPRQSAAAVSCRWGVEDNESLCHSWGLWSPQCGQCHLWRTARAVSSQCVCHSNGGIEVTHTTTEWLSTSRYIFAAITLIGLERNKILAVAVRDVLVRLASCYLGYSLVMLLDWWWCYVDGVDSICSGVGIIPVTNPEILA